MPASFPHAELFAFLTLTIIHRKEKDADPVEWDKVNYNLKYWYSKTTSTTSLRPHLARHHADLYLRLAKERGWEVQLPGYRSQAQSQAASDASAPPLVQFSEERFQQHLLNFIIADDQVRLYFVCFYMSYAHISFWIKALNLVECPEFCQLLQFLRSGLNVPGRTKMHELLLQAWRTQFHFLRQDLEVCRSYLLLIVCLNFVF